MDEVDLAHIGPQVEHHPTFPGGVNTEFVQVLSATELRMRVWERGSGIASACGTGACAAAAAAAAKGFCEYLQPIQVRLDGGYLEITVAEDGSVTMLGPAETVYEGETSIC
jgi:diaminopimelate epimerase